MASKRDKKRMEFMLNRRDPERRRLYKRAAQMRKAAQEPDRDPRHKPDWSELDDWDGDDRPERMQKRRRHRGGSLDEWAEELAREEASWAGPEEGLGEPDDAPLEAGVVLGVASGRCRVWLEDGSEAECLLPPELAAFQKTELAVGDAVHLAHGAPGGEPTSVVEVLPRRTALSRHDSGPGGRHLERVIAANVDVVVIVAAVASPPLRPGLLDRYLVAIELGGAEAVIALTKVDLLEEPGALDGLLGELGGYAALDVPVVTTSSVDGRGVATLAAMLRGATTVFVGQSGVGKSSLLNALDPSLGIATQTVGAAAKGRHTTTGSTLHRLEGDTRIIDTPGIREFGLWAVGREELRHYFHDFDAHADGCRFKDCSHAHEPDCAVLRAVRQGRLSKARHESYLRILASL